MGREKLCKPSILEPKWRLGGERKIWLFGPVEVKVVVDVGAGSLDPGMLFGCIRLCCPVEVEEAVDVRAGSVNPV